MNLSFLFFLESVALGAGLAMDAFSVSLANGLNEPCMKKGKAFGIAAVFALFQATMPMIGWVLVHTFLEKFKAFEPVIPYIALGLLAFIGGKMLFDGIKGQEENCESGKLGICALLVQGVATSIDALSVGFTIADYTLGKAVIAAAVIALVTFIICAGGVFIGKKCGTKLAGKAQIFGGIILIVIGIEIFLTGILS